MFALPSSASTAANVDDEDDDIYETAFSLNESTIFEVLEPGIYVAMRSPPNSIEHFFVGAVVDQGVAKENIRDANGHFIVEGKYFAIIHYLQMKER